MPGPEDYGKRPEGAEPSTQDKIRKRATEDDRLARIVERADRFSELQESAAWRELYAEVKAKRQRLCDQIAHKIMYGQPVDMEAVDRERAFIQGAVWILSHPEEAWKTLEDNIAKAMEFMETDEEED